MKEFYRLGLFFFITVGLTACNNVGGVSNSVTPEISQTPSEESFVTTPESIPSLQIADGCIQPFETFAYKVYPDEKKPVLVLREFILPVSPWKVVETVPIPKADDFSYHVSTYLRGVNNKGGSPEIWIESNYMSINAQPHKIFLVYQPQEKKWKSVDVNFSTNDGGDYTISKLIFGEEGSVWGVVDADNYMGSVDPSVALLSKYDDAKGEFEFDTDFAKAFSNFDIYRQKADIFYDNGTFWLVVYHDAIYRYDLREKTVEKMISIDSLDLVASVLDPGNSIYLLTDNSQSMQSEHDFYQYSIEENKLIQMSIPSEIRYAEYSNMLVDHRGRLYLDDVAWLEPDGEWYMMIQPAIFISDRGKDQELRLRIPSIEAETSDGRLWFLGSNGSTWMDPERQLWCWFTTSGAIPYEDSDRNLWIIVDDKLYEAPVSEE